jgi:hypothetical protein
MNVDTLWVASDFNNSGSERWATAWHRELIWWMILSRSAKRMLERLALPVSTGY